MGHLVQTLGGRRAWKCGWMCPVGGRMESRRKDLQAEGLPCAKTMT